MNKLILVMLLTIGFASAAQDAINDAKKDKAVIQGEKTLMYQQKLQELKLKLKTMSLEKKQPVTVLDKVKTEEKKAERAKLNEKLSSMTVEQREAAKTAWKSSKADRLANREAIRADLKAKLENLTAEQRAALKAEFKKNRDQLRSENKTVKPDNNEAHMQ